MNYNDAVEWLLGLPDMERASSGPLARTMSLAAMQALLVKLGSPHRDRNTVHVTGSKGKGSTSAFITGMLHAAGHRTALYQSPHLHDYTERILLDMQPVERNYFAETVEKIAEHVNAIATGKLGPVSTFGALTALFFCIAKDKRVDWQVVEVGMGGALDATNVFDEKELSVITSISLEHTAVLGTSTAEIARHKAGIITPGCTVILAPQRKDDVREVVQDFCLQRKAHLIEVSRNYVWEPATTGKQMHGTIKGRGKSRKVELAMRGQHQVENLLTATAAIDALNDRGWSISDACIESAAASVAVPGRLELIARDPQVIVDGAHNAESAQALYNHLKGLQARRRYVLLGTNLDKDVREILRALAPVADLLVATRSKNNRSRAPESIAEAASEFSLDCIVEHDLEKALTQVLAQARENDLICITGSLYVVAEAREFFGHGLESLWRAKEKILK